MKTILIAAVYYLIVTPIGFLVRLVRDPLDRRPRADVESYLLLPTGARNRRRAFSPSTGDEYADPHR